MWSGVEDVGTRWERRRHCCAIPLAMGLSARDIEGVVRRLRLTILIVSVCCY